MQKHWRRALVEAAIVLTLSHHVGASEETTLASTIQLEIVQLKTNPTSCEDRPGTIFIDGVKQMVSCNLVATKWKDEKVDICQRTISKDGQEAVVFNLCPVTCGDVGLGPCAPSASPSGSPSDSPSTGPLRAPSVGPSFSPSSSPSGRSSTVPIAVPSSSPSGSDKSPSVSLFVDITEKIFEYASDEVAHPWVVKPWVHFRGPTTFDVNGDGFPDMLSHHHIGLVFDGGPGIYWDFATSTVNTNNDISYKAVRVDVQYNARIPDPFVPGIQDVLIDCIKEPNLQDGIMIKDFVCINNTDFHGFAVLDFDRDGKLDVFNTIGAVNGTGEGIGVESMLFWGVDGTNPDTIESKSNLHFAGGRGALQEAGLSSGEPQRSYGIYAADFNNDGYLDIFYFNKYRREDLRAPGMIYISRGASEPRHFDAHHEVSEYSKAALLTDFDQDGFANEFLILQRGCDEPEIIDDKNCIPEPRCVVYKWDVVLDSFVQIWTSSPFEAGTILMSSASGDFNGDGLTDIVILVLLPNKKEAELHFWYSSKENELLGNSTLVVDIPSDCKPRHSMRAADFNLDGTLDLFILCFTGNHKIFQQSPHDGKWSLMDSAILGPLGESEQSKALTIAFIDRCFSYNLDQCELDPIEFANYEELLGDGEKPNGHSVAQGVTVFDFNNDGFLDFYLVYKMGYNVFFENKGVPGNKFVSLKLKGTTSNVDGIGAIVLLTWNNGVDTDESVQLREHSCQSFESDTFGSRDSRILFGIGKTGVPLRLEVRWPSGKVSMLTKEMLEDTPMTMNYNKIMTITEPE